MPKLLALDLSSNVGWAVLERGVKTGPVFGTMRLPPALGEDQGARFARLYDWLVEMRALWNYDALAYERPILPRKSGDLATTMDTLMLLWNLCGTVRHYAYDYGLRCISCPVDQAKITLTGSKFAQKDDMVAAAMKKFDWKVADDHQADAGAVGVWAYERLWPKAKAA